MNSKKTAKVILIVGNPKFDEVVKTCEELIGLLRSSVIWGEETELKFVSSYAPAGTKIKIEGGEYPVWEYNDERLPDSEINRWKGGLIFIVDPLDHFSLLNRILLVLGQDVQTVKLYNVYMMRKKMSIKEVVGVVLTDMGVL